MRPQAASAFVSRENCPDCAMIVLSRSGTFLGSTVGRDHDDNAPDRAFDRRVFLGALTAVTSTLLATPIVQVAAAAERDDSMLYDNLIPEYVKDNPATVTTSARWPLSSSPLPPPGQIDDDDDEEISSERSPPVVFGSDLEKYMEKASQKKSINPRSHG